MDYTIQLTTEPGVQAFLVLGLLGQLLFFMASYVLNGKPYFGSKQTFSFKEGELPLFLLSAACLFFVATTNIEMLALRIIVIVMVVGLPYVQIRYLGMPGGEWTLYGIFNTVAFALLFFTRSLHFLKAHGYI